MPDNKLITVIALALIMLTSCGSTEELATKELTLAERFAGAWNTEFDLGIAKALGENGVQGCGEFKYKSSSQDQGEYLVHCSRDGETWVAYLVWVPSEVIMGPYAPEL